MTSRSNSGKKILLTRPKGSNEALADALKQAGYDVRILPLLSIKHCPDAPQTKQIIMNIDQCQHVICCSKHAAGILAEYLDQYWPQMPTGVQWYTLGRTSAVPLQNLTLIVHCPEQGHTSEDLLQLHSLTQVAGQKILLVKGKGGRDLLQHNLMQRGAYVTLLELYQRVGINYPLSVINQILMEWRPDAIVMLSGETIGQFRSLSRELGYVGERHPSQQVTVVVPGKRVAAIAEAFNYRTIIASSAEDNEILRTIGETLPAR